MMKTKITLIFLILLNLITLNIFANNFSYTRFDGHSRSVNSVAFSHPDGRMIASCSVYEIRLWNAKTGALLKILTGQSGHIYSVAFSPDEQTLASGSSETIRLWDVNTGELLKTINSGYAYSIAFSPDGKTIASGGYYDHTVHLWDINTGERLQKFTGHSNYVSSVAFSIDGKMLVSGSGDDTVRLWDVNTGVNLKTLTGHRYSVYSVAFSPDERTIASGSSYNIRLWDINTGKHLNTLSTGGEYSVYSVVFSPDGNTIASGRTDDTIQLWDAATGEQLNTLTGHGGDVNSVAFSPDGKSIVSGSDDRTIRLWDINTGEPQQKFIGHQEFIHSVAFSPDGKTIVSGDDDAIIHFWDVSTGGYLKSLEALSANYLNSIIFSADWKTLAGVYHKTIHLHDMNTGELLHTLTGHGAPVNSVAFSPVGQMLASGSADDTIRLWDISTGEHLNTLTGHGGDVNSVAFSPDGQTLASGGWDNTIRLWDANTGKPLKTLKSGDAYSIAFSPDGQTLASGGYFKTIELWDVNTGERLKSLRGHRNYVYSVVFSPDGQTLASGSRDATIRLWDVATGGHLKTLTGHSASVYSVAFSPDGNTLASGGYDETLRLWDLPPTRVTLTPNPVVPPAIGEQFTVNIGIVAGSNIFGYEFSLMFDPDVVRFVESANEDYLSGAFLVPPVVSANTVQLATTALNALGNGDGTLASVTFEVVDVTESVITLFDLKLIDTAEALVHSFEDSAFIEPSLMPSDAVVSLTPDKVDSPSIGEQLTLNVDITGGQDVTRFQPFFHYETSAFKYIEYTSADYISNGGTGDGMLGTVTFEVLDVQNSTVGVSGYLVAPNGLRSLPTFVSARVIIPILGDVNKDGVVNILDLVETALYFGQTVSEGGNPADVNEDGVVNIRDLVKVAGAFGEGTAAPAALRHDLKGVVSRASVQKWLNEARLLSLTDPTSLQGIRFLEQLLAALTPKKTALLPNYPNPFNPETWIPYQLAKSADVSISIYAADGTLVRRLDLGHQVVGVYQHRRRAAHWNGKNDIGEAVASGVYFYTLTAGDFSATRKMLILK